MLNQVEGVTNPWKFAGGYLDASGYYQFGVRYYDPSLGRWTQQDSVGGSLGDLNSVNRYTYANDDPVNLVDPSGKDALGCILAGAYTLGTVLLAAGGLIGVLAAFSLLPPPWDIFGGFGALAVYVGTLAFAVGATIQEYQNCLG